MARTSNAGPLDFEQGIPLDELTSDPDNRSVFARKLTDLREAVRDGKAKQNTAYLLGTYGNASGARSAIKALNDGDKFPPGATFELRAQIVDEDGKRVSKLWGAVTEVTPLASDATDGDGTADDVVATGTTAETPAGEPAAEKSRRPRPPTS